MAASEQKGKKPTENLEGIKVALGSKTEPAKGEVTGHMSPGAVYHCWYCEARNYVPYGWNYFICWACDRFNVV